MTNIFKRFSRWMDYNPPGSLSSEGWGLFRREFKREAPVRYWFTYTVRGKVILPIKWKYDSISDWIRYRTVRRYHVVKTGLEPGYSDVREKILYTNFTMLVDFVEVEQAWHNYICDSELRKSATWSEKYLPFFRWYFRKPELGIKYLEWAATLDDPAIPPHERCEHQAVAARETFALYDWWKNKRPARVEIEWPDHQRSPEDDDDLDIFDYNRTPEEHLEHSRISDLKNKQEEDWDKEDEEMLIRLMKVRLHLWT